MDSTFFWTASLALANDGGGPAVVGDLDDFVGGVGLVDQREKLVFGLSQRYRSHGANRAGILATC